MNRTRAVTVRPARRTELRAISSLFKQTLKALPYYNPLAKKTEIKKYTATKLQTKLRSDRYSVLVAVDEGKNIIGFCFNHFDDYTIWLDWFGVRNLDRRKGVSAEIIRTLCSAALKRGAHKIWCDTRSSNEPSKRFLRTLGFRKIATIKNHWFKQDFILWEKPV